MTASGTVKSIMCQIDAIGTLASDPGRPYSLGELRDITNALRLAERAIENEIAWRVTANTEGRGGMTFIQFKGPYRPNPRNGSVYVMEVPVAAAIDPTTGDPTATVTHFDVAHESASGDSFGTFSTHETRAEAVAVARREAVRLNAIYEPGPEETAVDTFAAAVWSPSPDGGAA